jgi:ABC-type transport system involved in multi-copper enzyme maturation permease subunit
MIDFALLRDVLASEWTKLRSVRSTVWTVLVAILLGIGLGTAISAANAHAYNQMSLTDKLTFDPTAISLSGLFFAQLAMGVMAILAMSAEYSTGTIRTSLAAVPQRGYLLAAKAIIVLFSGLIVGEIIAFSSFELGQLIFARHHLNTTLSDPGVLRAVVGGGAYLAGLALLAVGLAAIIRHTAAAITTLVGVVFILPGVAGLLPAVWRHDLVRYLPAESGGAIAAVIRTSDSLPPWGGLAVFAGWVALTLGIAWFILTRRDV